MELNFCYPAKVLEEIDVENLKHRTFRGVSALVLRNILGQPISFFGFVFLSVFLKRWQLGVFWAVSEVVGFLGYFSDIGLAAALIQSKKKPTKEEIRATFTLQQILVLAAVAVSLILLPFLSVRFHFGQDGTWLFYALLFGFFIASLKTIPSVLLERKMAFEKIALVDLSEQITFTVLAVLLAWKGWGLYSWVVAVTARAIVGVTLMYVFAPWPIGFSLHLGSIKRLLRFGVPFQVNSLLAVAKDRLMNIFLWGILGSDGVGILGWAQRWAQLPLRFLMDQVIRVTFPAYSKLQANNHHLRLALERSIFLLSLLVFPVFVGLALTMPWVVEIWPKYHKWSIAIVPFWFYLVNYSFGLITTPITNAFNAVGKVNWTFKLMVFWTGLTWLLVPWMAKEWGTTGAAAALALVSATSGIAWYWARRKFDFSLWRVLARPFLITGLMAAVVVTVMFQLTPSLPNLVLLATSGVLVYLLGAWFLARQELLWLFQLALVLWQKRR